MISGDAEGETGQLQRANIQSRRYNKRKTKDSSGWQDAPGAAVLLCWKGLLSCGVGAIRDWTIDGGRVQAQQPIHEVLSAQRK